MNNTLETWGKVKLSDTLVIKDEITIANSLRNHIKGAIAGVTTQVTEITYISEKNGSCDWKVIKTAGNGIVFYILVKKVGELFDVRVYQENDWLKQGTRGDLINAKQFFLFCEPKGNWTPKDLEAAVSFNLDIDNKQIAYDQKNPSMYGEASVLSSSENRTGLFAGVTEYSTNQKVENDEILVYEIGGMKDGKMQDVGGWVTFLEGYNVRNEEIDILTN